MLTRSARYAFGAILAALTLPAAADTSTAAAEVVVPETLWDHREESDEWSLAAIAALKTHGSALVEDPPEDVDRWCPGFEDAPDAERRAFWVGFLSALAEHESTWKPGAVGGDDQWFGLLQIGPATAADYGCAATTGNALQDGEKNLACGIRIMATTVPRDGVIAASEPDWSGVAADWAPLRNPDKSKDMRQWLRAQDYCQIQTSVVPQPRERSRRIVGKAP